MNLSNLKYSEGARKNKRRVGRGTGSGRGKTSGKGHKGQNARSGATKRSWFEGGQMPLQRRVPKRGFTNIFRKEYSVVNVGDLERCGENEVSPDVLRGCRLVRKKNTRVKVLGNGELKKPLNVKAHSFSKSATKKIEEAGGKAIIL